MLFSKQEGLDHGIGLLKCLTLRIGPPSGHSKKQYNHNEYMGSGLDQVISETCVKINHGKWGVRKSFRPHLHLTRWWG